MTIALRTFARRGRRHRGQILIMTLLALVLLASMVFFVFNTGEQVNRRMTVQNAADSAGLGGANWMARSMNVEAMNNVGQSRLIAMVGILDSMPLATRLTYQELKAITDGLIAQRASLPADARYDLIRTGLDAILYQEIMRSFGDQNYDPGLVIQLNRVAPVYAAMFPSGVEDPTIVQSTHWQVPGQVGPLPHGRLWVGAKALEDFNRATYLASGTLSQITAVRMGSDCIDGGANADLPLRDRRGIFPSGMTYAASFLNPVVPEMAAKRGTFQDFRNPIMTGMTPERALAGRQFADLGANCTGDVIRDIRGPYDMLFKWRKPQITWVGGTGGHMVSPGVTVRTDPRNARGQPGLSPPAPGSAYSTPPVYEGGTPGFNRYEGQFVYGIYDWALSKFSPYKDIVAPNSGMVDYCDYHIPSLSAAYFNMVTQSDAVKARTTPNFMSRLKFLSGAKLSRMFGVAGAANTIHEPIWIAGYPAALTQAATNRPAIKYTWYWVLRVRSSIDPLSNPANYMKNPSTFALGNVPKARNPKQDPAFSCSVLNGWVDINDTTTWPVPPKADDPGRPDRDPAQAARPGQRRHVRQRRADRQRGPRSGRRTGRTRSGLTPTSAIPTPSMTPRKRLFRTRTTVYVRDFFVFFGVDVGGDIPIRNPANWTPGAEQPISDDYDVNQGRRRRSAPAQAFPARPCQGRAQPGPQDQSRLPDHDGRGPHEHLRQPHARQLPHHPQRLPQRGRRVPGPHLHQPELRPVDPGLAGETRARHRLGLLGQQADQPGQAAVQATLTSVEQFARVPTQFLTEAEFNDTMGALKNYYESDPKTAETLTAH